MLTLKNLASKYSHAAVFPVVMGFEREDGKRNYPVACMVANLAKPTPEAPALMRHDGTSFSAFFLLLPLIVPSQTS